MNTKQIQLKSGRYVYKVRLSQTERMPPSFVEKISNEAKKAFGINNGIDPGVRFIGNYSTEKEAKKCLDWMIKEGKVEEIL